MIKLSDRLLSIAEEINTKTMADIGTDHGFLPIYLYQNEICDKVIMTDVSKGSLEKARVNSERYCPDAKFDLRLGSGLEVIEMGEVETVVLAGMGSPLIAKLIEQDIEKSKSFTFIIQPRRHEEYLREWLDKNKFQIIKEKLVKERNLICQVLVVRYNEDYQQQNYDYMFPDSILDSELAEAYLSYWITKAKRNYNSAKQGSDEKDMKKWEEAIGRINYLRGKLNDI